MAKHLKCSYIDYGLNFFFNDVRVCCKEIHSGIGMPLISKIEDFTIEKMIEKKAQLKEMLYNNIVPECCQNCHYIREFEEEDQNFDFSVGLIDINSSVKCNSRCIYCNRPKLMKTFKENS